MGHGKWNSESYTSYSNKAATQTRGLLYSKSNRTSVGTSGQKVNIEEIDFRESRDSTDNPLSTPVMVGLDVTGSMGMIPEAITKGGLGILMGELLQKKPITDPQLLFMGIGDAVAGDMAPLQITQFESDNCICDQLTDLWLEGGGGGNSYESYDLAWAFASYKTKTDAWEKRQQKGFLFTVGDELFPQDTSSHYLRDALKLGELQSPTPELLLEEASKQWNVYHITIQQGYYASRYLSKVENSWGQHLQKRSLILSNYDYLSQLIISAIALENGEDFDEVMSWWDQGCVKVLSESFQNRITKI